jgi:hypothetical protein
MGPFAPLSWSGSRLRDANGTQESKKPHVYRLLNQSPRLQNLAWLWGFQAGRGVRCRRRWVLRRRPRFPGAPISQNPQLGCCFWAPQQGLKVGGVGADALDAGVDHQRAAFQVVRPCRDEPPAQEPGLGLAFGCDDREHVLGGCDVVRVAVGPLTDLDAEALSELLAELFRPEGVGVAPADTIQG